MCTLADLTHFLKGKIIDEFKVDADCGGQFIYIKFTDNTSVNITESSEGETSLNVFGDKFGFNGSDEKVWLQKPHKPEEKVNYGNRIIGIWHCLNCHKSFFPRELADMNMTNPLHCIYCGTLLTYDEEE
jgi:hypothetical protein